jgi:hypothetical protein
MNSRKKTCIIQNVVNTELMDFVCHMILERTHFRNCVCFQTVVFFRIPDDG